VPAARDIPILAMCLTKDTAQVDKMILKQAEVLPHGDFIRTEEDLGRQGRRMVDYVAWLAARVAHLGGDGYRPTLHLDVYGTLGECFAMNLDRIADFLGRLEERAEGLPLLIECPIIAPSQDEQIAAFQGLREALRRKGCRVRIIADEWCNTLADVKRFADAGAADYLQVKAPDLGGLNNTIESLLYCKQAGVGAYLGGSGNETDQSARISAHVALACNADLLIGKPGQGVDEALMIERNEMRRARALIAWRAARTTG
jgi:methylaspartate ammonia-lyase